ncbi:MAG: trigger factor [Planctomycetes bacterium]|nr:trigger factor [Planctomycetota bacterium]
MAENEEKTDAAAEESETAANETAAADESTETVDHDQTQAEEAKENVHDKNTVTIEDSGSCKKKITVEIPEETIKALLDEQYQDLRREAAIPGFRKGRAPVRLIEKRFGTEIGLQVKVKLLADASQAAIDANKLDVLGDPDIDHEKVELPETGSMTFDFEVEVRPEFDLPKLEGVAVEKPKVELTDEEIDAEIMAMRRQAGIWTPKEDAPIEEDDQIVAGVVMEIEDVEEHEKLDNIEIVVREMAFVGPVPVEGLSDLLVGAKVGDEKKTTIEVPKTFHNEQYRGKKVDITIEVKDIKQLDPAEMNAEFLERFGVDNEDDLREKLMEYRRSRAEREARASMAEQIHRYLLDNTKVDLPEAIVADQSTRLLQRQYTNMLMQGMQREELDQQMQQIRAGSDAQAEEQLKLFFLMDKIAEALDITTSEEEINGHIAQVAAARNRRPEKVREELAKDGSLTQFILQVREQKCVEKILENAKITDAKPEKKKAAKPKKAKKKEDKPTKKEAAKPTKKAAAKPETANKKTEKKTEKKKEAREDTSRENATAKRTKKTTKKKE